MNKCSTSCQLFLNECWQYIPLPVPPRFPIEHSSIKSNGIAWWFVDSLQTRWHVVDKPHSHLAPKNSNNKNCLYDSMTVIRSNNPSLHIISLLSHPVSQDFWADGLTFLYCKGVLLPARLHDYQKKPFTCDIWRDFSPHPSLWGDFPDFVAGPSGDLMFLTVTKVQVAANSLVEMVVSSDWGSSKYFWSFNGPFQSKCILQSHPHIVTSPNLRGFWETPRDWYCLYRYIQ